MNARDAMTPAAAELYQDFCEDPECVALDGGAIFILLLQSVMPDYYAGEIELEDIVAALRALDPDGDTFAYLAAESRWMADYVDADPEGLMGTGDADRALAELLDEATTNRTRAGMRA